MSDKWEETTIGTFCPVLYGKGLSASARRQGNVPVYGSNGIVGSHDIAYSNDAGIVIGRKGSIGEVHLSKIPFWPIDTTFFIQKAEHYELRYVYYLMLSLGLSHMNSDSAVPGLNRDALHGISIIVPPLQEQRAIAEVLGSLDDKIELNRRMNHTLEALVKAVFRQRFVEGDGIDGWEVGKLGDVAVNIRRSISAKNINPNSPYIGLEHMPRGSISLSQWGNAFELSSNKFVYRTGDLLFGKLRPYFFKVGVAPTDGVCSTDILVIRPKEPEWYSFVLGHLTSFELINTVTASAIGTKMPRTSWQDIAKFEVALPPVHEVEAFSSFTRPIIQNIRSNIMQSRTLGKLRDALLPKLLSGEIRIRDAQQYIESEEQRLAA